MPSAGTGAQNRDASGRARPQPISGSTRSLRGRRPLALCQSLPWAPGRRGYQGRLPAWAPGLLQLQLPGPPTRPPVHPQDCQGAGTARVQGPGLRWEDIIAVGWPSLPAQASGPELGGALTQPPGPRTNPAGPAARPTSRRPGRPLSWEPSALRLRPGGHGHVHTPTLGFTAASEQAAAASLG